MLEREGADPVYVRAYTLAAASVRHWPISMAVMYRHRGVEGLENVLGVGPGIARVIRELVIHRRLPPLAGLLNPAGDAVAGWRRRTPSVEEMLDVDREYRQKAAAGELPLIAPQRFNPTGDHWLPVLHTSRGPRRYTALYSKYRARASAGPVARLGRTVRLRRSGRAPVHDNHRRALRECAAAESNADANCFASLVNSSCSLLRSGSLRYVATAHERCSHQAPGITQVRELLHR